MSTANAVQRPRPTTTQHAEQAHHELAALVDRMVDAMQPHDRISPMAGALEQLAPSVEKLLPPKMKGQGRWLCAQAAAYFDAKGKDLEKCPPHQFIRAVCTGAAMGLAIDGVMGYCVPFKGVFQFMPDWKGLVAVARSAGLITDCQPFTVKEKDEFEYSGGVVTIHKYPPGNVARGAVIGAYAKVTLPDGTIRHEYMDLEELTKIKNFSQAKNGPWNGPFADEMYKKCPVRRAMKSFRADPTMQRAVEADEVAEQLDALTSLETAGLTSEGTGATPTQPQEVPQPTREQLEMDLKTVKDEAKAKGLLNGEKWAKLMTDAGVVGGKFSMAQLVAVGSRIQEMIDEARASEPDTLAAWDEAPVSSTGVPEAMRQ